MENTERSLVESFSSKERVNIFKKAKRYGLASELDLKKWHETKSLVSDKYFKEKLSFENLTESEFAESIRVLEVEDYAVLYEELLNQPWFVLFHKIQDHYNNLTGIEQFGTVYIIQPFVSYFEKCVFHEFNDRYNNICVTDSAKERLLSTIGTRIFDFFSKVLVLELNKRKENDELKGNSPEERFQYFIAQYLGTSEELFDFYKRYPVLLRRAVTKIEFLIQFIQKALSNLDHEYFNILEESLLSKGSSITEISIGEGDSHQKGSSVILYEFDSGHKLVYKPRNLKIVESYHDFIVWINNNSKLLELKTGMGIYRDDYCFERFIDNRDCENIAGVKNYYERFGYIIAIAFVLCGNDFHLENLIAHGEYPMLIDLETLVQGEIQLDYNDSASYNVKRELLQKTVLNTCLLPTIMFRDHKEGSGVDMSALNGKEFKLPFKVLLPTGMNTDNFRFEYTEFTKPGSNNLVRYHNTAIEFLDYIDNIIKGFDEMMLFFIKRKDDLVQPNGVLFQFKGKLVRNVIKNTQRYMSLLGYSTHPNYACDMLKREKLLENMWAYPYVNKQVVIYENQDMMLDDIPIFFSYTDSKDLISSDGELITNFFEASGYDLMMERIKELNQNMLDKQKSIILVQLGKFDQIVKELNGESALNQGQMTFESLDLLEESCRIGERLIDCSISSNDGLEISWGGILLNHQANWEIGALNGSLYDGVAGIALFLYELYYVTKENKYYTAYRKAMRAALTVSKGIQDISGYTGQISLLFPILNEYLKEGKSEFLNNIEEKVDSIDLKNSHMEHLDFVTGYSGTMMQLLIAYDILKNKKYLDMALEIGEIIVKSIDLEKMNDVGLGHGCSGIALSLFKLHKYTGNEEFRNIALSLLDKERNIMNHEDYKEVPKWCWGTTGAGIARIEILQYYEDDMILTDIKKAVDNICNTMKKEDGLCHGNMADIELLNRYREISRDREKIFEAKIINIFERKEEFGDYSLRGLPEFQTLDLFNGIAGVGYELLRIYNRKQVSDVLTLSIHKI